MSSVAAAIAAEPRIAVPATPERTSRAVARTWHDAVCIGPEIGRDVLGVATLLLAAAIVAMFWASLSAVVPASTATAGLLAVPVAVAAAALAAMVGLTRQAFDCFAPAADSARWAMIAFAACMIGLVVLVVSGAPWEAWIAFSAVTVVACAALAASRQILAALIARTGASRLFKRRVAVFGAGVEADVMVTEAARVGHAIHVVGVFDDRRSASRRDAMKAPLAGTGDDLEEQIREGLVDDVVITLPVWAAGRTAAIVERLACHPVNVHSSLALIDAAGVVVEDGRVTRLGSLVLQCLYRNPLEGWQGIAKAALDRAIAAAALVVLSPLFLLIGLAIRGESAGPVFFRQARLGLSGRPITVWKFRSMRTLENGASVRQAAKADPRVTRVGALLRRTSLDELPQLINVVLGEMSLVGPRPHAVAHDLHYAKIVDGYNRRQKFKPGITGLAQIGGYRGETRDPALMQARIDQDLRYIRGWSLALDLKIIMLTPSRGLVHANAY